MHKPLYRCSQIQLITIADTGWRNFLRHLASFEGFRGYYNEAFATNQLAAVNAALMLPDSAARYANVAIKRIHLVAAATACLARWQSLKRYIGTSFPTESTKSYLVMAGARHYAKAKNHNWDELQAMNTSASNFMTKYAAELAANDNMPASFPALFAADAALCDELFFAFIKAEQAAYIATEQKVAACNAVYTAVINMFKDGQELFKHQEGFRREFTFDTVLGLISNHSQHPIATTEVADTQREGNVIKLRNL